MGFDIYGLKAKNKRGEYFRNNVWWWKPLAKYVIKECNIPEKEQNDWLNNNGHKVSEATAMNIAKKLKELVKNGHTKDYEIKRKRFLEDLSMVKCETCNGTGERHDDIVDGECNGCNGKGKVKDFKTHYPFSVENVKEFADFCESSGGFEIY